MVEIFICRTSLTAAGGLALNETISRPVLHPSSTIQINREGQIGPNPVAVTFDELASQLLVDSGYDTSTLQFIVSGVASGYVEKTGRYEMGENA